MSAWTAFITKKTTLKILPHTYFIFTNMSINNESIARVNKIGTLKICIINSRVWFYYKYLLMILLSCQCLFAWADFIDTQMFSQQIQTVRSRPCFSLWNHSYFVDLQPKPLTHFDVGTQWQHHLGGKKEKKGGLRGFQPSLLPDSSNPLGFEEKWLPAGTD